MTTTVMMMMTLTMVTIVLVAVTADAATYHYESVQRNVHPLGIFTLSKRKVSLILK